MLSHTMIRMSRPPPTPPYAGIDALCADADGVAALSSSRVALLANAASRTKAGETSAAALAAAIGVGTIRAGSTGLVRLFAPEHGWALALPAGAPVADATVGDALQGNDAARALPVTAIYPALPATLPADFDTLVVDLTDIGVRCFTYAASAATLIAALAEYNPALVLCERANPLGPGRAGPLPEARFRGLLAAFDEPFVHGRTIASLLFDEARRAGFGHVTVYPARPRYGAGAPPWTPPSPALTTPDAVRLYPGLVLLEGVEVSVGRGTPYPFRVVLGPGIDAPALADWVNRAGLGVLAAPIEARPESDPFAGTPCSGVHLSIENHIDFNAFRFGIHLVHTLITRRWAGWLTTPAGEPFIDRLLASDALRRAIDRGDPPEPLLAAWDAALEHFSAERRQPTPPPGHP